MKDKLEKIRVLNKKQRHINDYFMLEYSKICMIDFTSWYFILKHFKLEQFNIISFFSLSKVTPMSSTYLDYVKYRYKSNKFSKVRLILPNFRKSGHLQLAKFFFQWCPLIGERTVVSIHLISCGTHVSAWHMYRTGGDLILFFTFILSFKNDVTNE